VPVSSFGNADVASLKLEPGAAVVVIDPAGTIVAVDDLLQRQFGYTREEVVGQRIEMLVPGAALAMHRMPTAAASPSQGSPGGDLFGQRRDGSRVAIEVEWNRISTSDGAYIIASILDLAGRRRQADGDRPDQQAQQRFERLLTNFSFRFSNVPEDELAAAIATGLREVCEHLGLERGSFFRVDPEGVLFNACTWTLPGYVSEHWPLAAARHFPWTIEQVLGGTPVAFATVDDVPHDVDRASFRTMGSRSAVFLPLSVDGRVTGAVGFTMLSEERPWTPDLRLRLDLAAILFVQVLARQQRDDAMRAASHEIQQLKRQLQAPGQARREPRNGAAMVVGQSPAVRRVLDQIQQVATTDSTVLLLGDTGTGKELFAAQIHDLGARSANPMIKVNCAAIPATLIESELFGREKGAYTGALARQAGRFEMADHSTIFLDEIGDLPAEVQVKLLRVLEERTIERLGSPRPITVDVRIIAATHRNLEQRVAEGTFREDLYYRLNVFPIRVPPLRERVEDIPLLVWHFVEEFSRALGKRVDAIDKEVMTALQQYAWPGNVRELRNTVERALIVSTSRRLVIPLPQTTTAATRRSPKLVDVEKEHIRSVLESTGWRIRGSGGAADRLGLKPTTLETRMAKLGLRRPGHA
jgi:formate hydrogenlyase transcriptional activator